MNDHQPEPSNGETETRQCTKHGDYISNRIYGKIFSGCIKCTEEQREAATLAEEAAKQRDHAARIEELLEASGLVGRQLRQTFDNYEVKDERQQSVLDECRAYVGQFIKGKPAPKNTLWLIGKTGTGKSHLGSAMVNHLIRTHGIAARIHTGKEMISLMRSTWNREKPPRRPFRDLSSGGGEIITEQDMLDDLVCAGLLVFDDAGADVPGDGALAQLFDIVDLRNRAEKPTVVISNLTPAELKIALADRIYDRLREGATVKACNWAGMRGDFPTRGQ